MIYSYSVVSLPFFCTAPCNLKRNNVHQSVQPIKAQRYSEHDQGSRSSNNNLVDANWSVLSERIEKIKVKERLERCCRSDIYGWNYVAAAAECKISYRLYKRERSDHHQSLLMELLEFAAIVGGTLGFSFFTGTLFVYVVSLFVHLLQSS